MGTAPSHDRRHNKHDYVSLQLLMKTSRILTAILAALLIITLSAKGDIIELNLFGKAGSGLLSGNENGTILGTPGSGGELGGILYNTDTNLLTIDIGWGSGNGFTDLSGDATMGHIHGPTPEGQDPFTTNANVLIGLDNLTGWNPDAVTGGFDGSVTLSEAQEALLFQSRLYINVHTEINGGGEIRGNIVIPEPATLCLIAVGTAACLLWRWRFTRTKPI